MYATTHLTSEEQSKVPTPGYVPLTWEELELALSLPSDGRPRIYGYLEPAEGETHGQIVKLASDYYLERYTGRLSFAWASDTTLADLISKAGSR